VKNEPLDRRPRTSITGENRDHIDALIRDNRRITVRELSGILYISDGSVKTMLEGSQLMPQDCRAAIAWRRSSWKLTVRDTDPTNVCPFTTRYYTRYWVWNFEKGFKHSTHRAHKLDSAITLGYVNCFGCECNILFCTLPLRHTIKMLSH